MGQSPTLFDRQLLKRRRERAAGGAAAHDFLLRRVAEDFAERLAVVRRAFPLAANIGAHHGVLSHTLRQVAGVGTMIDADMSEALVAMCDDLRVVADEELLPFPRASLDLIVSGLALQFVNDLPGALKQMASALKPDGLLLAALIGGDSLVELRAAWLQAEAEIEGGASPRVAPMIDLKDAGALLQRAGLALPVVDSDVVTVTYATPLDLMRELKAMGASNVLVERRRRPTRRDTLARAAQIYAERFAAPGGRVMATFEIITLTAWAPDEGQPKPLKPGSAEISLAAALERQRREAEK